MNASNPSPSTHGKAGLLSVFVSLTSAFLLFGILVLLVFKWAGDPQTYDDTRALERAKKLETLQAKENKDLHENGWIDEKAGIAHITIDRAMELELKTLREKPIRAAAPIQPQDLNPTLITPPAKP